MVNKQGKKLWMSKTFWVNVIGLVIMIYQFYNPGAIVGPEATGGALVFINLILRTITNEPVIWK